MGSTTPQRSAWVVLDDLEAAVEHYGSWTPDDRRRLLDELDAVPNASDRVNAYEQLFAHGRYSRYRHDEWEAAMLTQRYAKALNELGCSPEEQGRRAAEVSIASHGVFGRPYRLTGHLSKSALAARRQRLFDRSLEHDGDEWADADFMHQELWEIAETMPADQQLAFFARHDSSTARAARVRLLEKLGRHAQARQELAEARARWPKSIELRKLEAEVAAADGDTGVELEIARQLLLERASPADYHRLKDVASRLGVWDQERPSALARIRRKAVRNGGRLVDQELLVDELLEHGVWDEAVDLLDVSFLPLSLRLSLLAKWQEAHNDPAEVVGRFKWMIAGMTIRTAEAKALTALWLSVPDGHYRAEVEKMSASAIAKHDRARRVKLLRDAGLPSDACERIRAFVAERKRASRFLSHNDTLPFLRQ